MCCYTESSFCCSCLTIQVFHLKGYHENPGDNFSSGFVIMLPLSPCESSHFTIKNFIISIINTLCVVAPNTENKYRILENELIHRIIDILRLENTSRMIVSTITSGLTSMLVNHVYKCHIHVPPKFFQIWSLHHFLGSLLQCMTILSVKKLFLISNLIPSDTI